MISSEKMRICNNNTTAADVEWLIATKILLLFICDVSKQKNFREKIHKPRSRRMKDELGHGHRIFMDGEARLS